MIDYLLLDEVAQGRGGWRHGIASLLKQGLVRQKGHYAVAVTLRGLLTLKRIFTGSRVVIANHRIPNWNGRVGTIISILDLIEDSDRFDEYGIPIMGAKPVICITARIDDEPGDWCFWNVSDLEALT